MAEINDLNITDASNIARWPENMAPSAVNDAGRADEGLLARWHKDTNGSKASTGSANAYVFAADQTLSAYYDGLEITFDANFANTGAATLNVDAVGASTIKKNGSVDLAADDIKVGQKVAVIYDGTNWQLQSPIGRLAQDVFNVAEYGATGDGTTDDTTAIQAAIDDAEAASGGIVSFFTGDFEHTGLTVSGTNGITLAGVGRGATGEGATLTYNGSATGDWITVSNAGKFALRDLTLRKAAALTLTGGIALSVATSPDVHVENISVLNPFNALSIATSGRGLYDHLDLREVSGSYAVYLAGTVADKVVANTLSNIQITSVTTVSPYDTAMVGLDVDSHVNSNFFINITAIYSWQGIRMRDDADGGNPPNWNYFIRCEMEKMNQHGINIIEAGALNRFIDPYVSEAAASGTGNGFNVASTATTAVLLIRGLHAGSCENHGIRLAASQYISIVDPVVGGNSQATSDTSSGLRVDAGVSNWHVRGGLLGGNGSHDPDTAGPQKFAVDIATGASDDFSIQDVDFGTNQTGEVSDGSTGTNKIIERNGTYLAKGEVRVAFGSLTAGVTNDFMFTWQNPHSISALVTRVTIQITTAGGTGGSLGNIGAAATAATESDNLLDGINLNATGIYDNVDDQGTNGSSKRSVDANGGTTDFVTGRITVANASSLVGTWRIEYVGI